MGETILLVVIGALGCSGALTHFALKRARADGIFDVPNERSSHSEPTPRGGGIAIVLASSGAFAVLTALRVIHSPLLISLAGGLAVAAAGFVDDRHSLPAAWRLMIHLGAALWAMIWLGGLPPIRLGGALLSFGPSGYVLGAMGIAWSINLFNFMDGIDGIASAEATFVSIAGGGLTLVGGGPAGAAYAAFAFGGACAGFLPWNWAPAKIFMGDVGSGYLGYVIAVLAIAAARTFDVALLVWSVLGFVFLADTAVTLVRRVLRGEHIYVAHRTHAYQWVARRWQSHAITTGVVFGLNVIWLLPWALLSVTRTREAVWFAIAAGVPILVLVVVAGAGRPERPVRHFAVGAEEDRAPSEVRRSV